MARGGQGPGFSEFGEVARLRTGPNGAQFRRRLRRPVKGEAWTLESYELFNSYGRSGAMPLVVPKSYAYCEKGSLYSTISCVLS